MCPQEVMVDKRVIVEGMDGSGKTTLVEFLWRKIYSLAPVVNTLGPDQDLWRWWKEQLLDRNNLVHDRFFYSELVYGPIIRGRLQVTPSRMIAVRNRIRKNSLLIYARPTVETIQASLGNKTQMKGVLEHFDNLLEVYDKIMYGEAESYGRRFYVYNWRHPEEPERVTKLVRSYLAGGLT